MSTASNSMHALPDWSAVPSNSNEDRELVNRRVAFFGAVFFVLGLAFYLYNSAMVSVIRRTLPPFTEPTTLLHAAATSVFGLQWLLCRSARRTSRELNLIDIGGLLAGLSLYAAMTISEASRPEQALSVGSGHEETLLISLIALATILTRAIIVPGTARRTFWVSLVASAIGPITTYVIMIRVTPAAMLAKEPFIPAVTTTYIGMWSLLSVTVATIAARVIYGLQQRVREASEIGQYVLEEKIGEGGMGVVYRARHAFLRRPTAIKLLPRESAGEHNVKRFEREVQLTSSLTHPNTIAVFDFGHTPDGIFYYAMEYLDGFTLEELVDHAGPQEPARVVHFLKQVCGALAEAHAVGLVHRDIKPANLMLCTRGLVPDQMKVLDFGLVKEHQSSGDLSTTNALLGTPLYMAPETIRDPESVDARVDLYALGAVGYKLLVGEPVFDGKTVIEVCSQHLHSEPIPPSVRSTQSIPRELERLVLSCLAKDPALRPLSAAAMLVELEALTEPSVWTRARAERWWDENEVAVRAAKQSGDRASHTVQRTLAVDLNRRSSSVI